VDTYPVQHPNHWLYLWPRSVHTTGGGNGEMGFISIDRIIGFLVVEGPSSQKEVAKEGIMSWSVAGPTQNFFRQQSLPFTR
jgi:hypothetical protein